jgi:hypothetical protein
MIVARDDRRFRFYGWAAGWLLLRAGKRSLKLGDSHEFAHCRAAIEAGNSDPCEDLPYLIGCPAMCGNKGASDE